MYLWNCPVLSEIYLIIFHLFNIKYYTHTHTHTHKISTHTTFLSGLFYILLTCPRYPLPFFLPCLVMFFFLSLDNICKQFLYRNYSPVNLLCILLIKSNYTVEKAFYNSKIGETPLTKRKRTFRSLSWFSKQKYNDIWMTQGLSWLLYLNIQFFDTTKYPSLLYFAY